MNFLKKIFENNIGIVLWKWYNEGEGGVYEKKDWHSFFNSSCLMFHFCDGFWPLFKN